MDEPEVTERMLEDEIAELKKQIKNNSHLVAQSEVMVDMIAEKDKVILRLKTEIRNFMKEDARQGKRITELLDKIVELEKGL